MRYHFPRLCHLTRLCICIIHFSVCYKASADSAVDAMVSLNITEDNVDVQVHDTIYIKCSGSPPLKWDYKNPMGSPIVSYSKEVFDSGNETVIRLTFEHQEATGRYICKNNHSEASVYIFVNGERLILADYHITIYNGIIPCISTASKVTMTLWKQYENETRDQVPLEFDRTKGFLATQQPEFFHGMFECVAEFERRNETHEVILEFLRETTAIPEVIISSSNATYVMSGSNFSLTCIVRTDSFALVDVTWSYPNRVPARNNETTKSVPDVTYRYTNNTLSIFHATADDTGSYLCTALDHSQLKNTAQVDVTVYETTPPTVLTFLEGKEPEVKNKHGKIVLNASYEVFPPTPNIQTKWTKDDEPIVSNFKHNAMHNSSSFLLEISDLNGNDSGLYIVTANASGYIQEKSFLLRVKDYPFVDIKVDRSFFYPLNKYNLSCEVKGYPKANISWSWMPFCFNESQCNSSNVASAWTTFENSCEVNNSTVRTTTEGIKTISHLSVVGEQSGFYKCIAENEMGQTEAEKLFVVSDAENGFEITYAPENSKESTQSVALCKASFVLYSDLQWKKISPSTNESSTVSTADFSKTPFSLQTELKASIQSDEIFVCAATRRSIGDVEEKRLPVQGSATAPPQNPGMNTNLLLILSFLGIFFLFIATVCFLKFRHKGKKKKVTLQDLNFAEGKLALFDSNLPLDEQVDILPYDETWEFPREKLKLGRTLGQGAFGRVVKAEAFEISEDGITTIVAVKMLKERTDLNQQKSLMEELKILIHLGHHVNIVNLMGAVTKNIRKEGIMVIVEYCRFGNIRHYLQRNRERFINEVDTQSGKVISTEDFTFFTDNEIGCDSNSELVHNSSSSSSGVFSVHNPNYSCCSSRGFSSRRIRGKSTICTDPRGSDCSHRPYLGSFSTSSGSYSRSDSQDIVVTTSDLLCFTFQCSNGMEYLASKKLIHRDLAARNILLAEGKIVKICDFGLAKDCYKLSNYVKKGDGPLPIKWMSIESIWDHVFTTKSDVWSFGILMWELFTLGGNPYPGLEIDEHFYKKLKSGYRMEKPELCPAFVYEIMKECWNADPDNRPHFSQISERLGNSLDESIKQHYIDVNEPYMEMNRKMKSPFYSNVERLELEDSVHPYVNSKAQDAAPDYDVPRTRSIVDQSVPSEPMEVVPMIQLESTCQGHPEAPRNKQETAEALDTEKFNIQDEKTASF